MMERSEFGPFAESIMTAILGACEVQELEPHETLSILSAAFVFGSQTIIGRDNTIDQLRMLADTLERQIMISKAGRVIN
jgi:hypothetical protein